MARGQESNLEQLCWKLQLSIYCVPALPLNHVASQPGINLNAFIKVEEKSIVKSIFFYIRHVLMFKSKETTRTVSNKAGWGQGFFDSEQDCKISRIAALNITENYMEVAKSPWQQLTNKIKHIFTRVAGAWVNTWSVYAVCESINN